MNSLQNTQSKRKRVKFSESLVGKRVRFTHPVQSTWVEFDVAEVSSGMYWSKDRMMQVTVHGWNAEVVENVSE